MSDPIRVLVVDDSAVARGVLTRMVEAQPDMRLAAAAGDGRQALSMLQQPPVEVVLLDLEMPGMSGLEALPHILDAVPGVAVIIVSTLSKRGAEITIRALAAGAADYVTKPSAGPAGASWDEIRDELVRKIRALCGPLTWPEPQAEDPAPEAAEPAGVAARPAGAPPSVVVMAASTGGPNALGTVLSGLPSDFPLPILVVQHMPALFTQMLAERLERTCGRPCREAEDGESVHSGKVYLAPGGRHMVVRRDGVRPRITLEDTPPENFCRPAADPLFRSAAAAYGDGVLAVILTGMGQDGLRGARAVAAAGGTILAQDRDSSVVWGMPGCVVRAGLAHATLPLHRIAEAIDRQARVLR